MSGREDSGIFPAGEETRSVKSDARRQSKSAAISTDDLLSVCVWWKRDRLKRGGGGRAWSNQQTRVIVGGEHTAARAERGERLWSPVSRGYRQEKTLSNELNLEANVSSLLCLNDCWTKAKSIQFILICICENIYGMCNSFTFSKVLANF